MKPTRSCGNLRWLVLFAALALAAGCVERKPILLINYRNETVFVKLNGMSEITLKPHSTRQSGLVTIDGGVDVEVRNRSRQVTTWTVSKPDLKASAVDGVMMIGIRGR